MRPSYDDPDETCDEGEPDDTGAVHIDFGQVLTWRDGRFVVVNKSELEPKITAARAAE